MAASRLSSYGNNNTASSVINQLPVVEQSVVNNSAASCNTFNSCSASCNCSFLCTKFANNTKADTSIHTCLSATLPSSNSDIALWHRKLGHPSSRDTPTCNIAQTMQAGSCNTGSYRYTNIDSVATQSLASAVTSSSKVQGLYNEQAEQCYTRRDDTKYHKSDRRVVAADVQVEAAASHDCRFSSPG
ncbi:hypothetical protein ACOSQ2_006357 [Xanthoceras sorbifolium]